MTRPDTEAELLFSPPPQHRHAGPPAQWEGHTGLHRWMVQPTDGSIARCGCGVYLRYGGSPSGHVGWHPISDRKARRLLKRAGAE